LFELAADAAGMVAEELVLAMYIAASAIVCDTDLSSSGYWIIYQPLWRLGMLHRVWERWKVIAHKIGIFQSRLLLNIFYFSILLPFGVGIKLFSDRLQLKPHQGPYWLGKASGSVDWEQAKRQF
jgi:hypothetical protein